MHQDPVTKSKRVTSMSGAVVSSVELDPFGADTSKSSNAAFQPRRFTSYDRDGNQSDEAMHRRYNRYHSRFDQPDPYEGSYDLADPQSFNRYAYAQSDPVNFIDPSGLNRAGPNTRYADLIGLSLAVGPGLAADIAGEFGVFGYQFGDSSLVINSYLVGPESSYFLGSRQVDPRGAFGGPGGEAGGDRGGDRERAQMLQSCVSNLLAKFFDRELRGSIRIHRDSLIVPPTMGAITIGDHIHFKKDQYDPSTLDGITLLAHEMAHAEQYRSAGKGTFLVGYAMSSASILTDPTSGAVSGFFKGDNLPHRNNAFEVAARLKAQKVRDHLEGSGYGTTAELSCRGS